MNTVKITASVFILLLLTPVKGHDLPDSLSNRNSRDEYAVILPDSFKIGEFIELYGQDSITIYFDCKGDIQKKSCANYYRKGRTDRTFIGIDGVITDFYVSGTIAMLSKMEKGYLSGPATYFHEDGQIQASGIYLDNKRIGNWLYYYKNGQLEKNIQYIDGKPFIVQYYNRKGRQRVKQGTGKYRGIVKFPRDCVTYRIKGRFIDGKMDGKWTLYSTQERARIGVEFFDEGSFSKGFFNGLKYTDKQKISLNSFVPNEHVVLTENASICPGEPFAQTLKYKNKRLNQAFYPDLQDSLNLLLNDSIPDQWLMVGLQISQNSLSHQVNIKSSIGDDATELKIYKILKSFSDFTPSIHYYGSVVTSHCFSILFYDREVIITPYYLYLYRLKK